MREIRKPEGFDSEKLFVLPDFVTSEITGHELTRGINLTDIGYFPKAKYHYRERMEGCDSNIFIYCAEGEGWIEFIGGKPLSMSEQHMIIIPSGTPHRYGASDSNPWSIYWFHLRGELINSLLDSFHLDTGIVRIPLSGYVKIVEAFDECYELLTNMPYSLQHHIHISQTMRHLISTLGMLSGGTAQDKRREAYMERAVHFMTDNLKHSITLTEIAEHTGLSRQHLICLFKKSSGFSPIDYFLRLKMQRAGQHLDLTDMSIKEIAASLGIEDPYYFSRLFKKVMGHAPSRYRDIQKG